MKVLLLIELMAIALLFYFVISNFIKLKYGNTNKISKEITNVYFNQLDKMIQYEVIYLVDAKLGKNMSNVKGMSTDIDNDELYDLYVNVQTTVLENMSDIMRNYLFYNFGERWIYDYIKIYAMSMIINYTNLSITSIIMAKK